VKVRGHPDGFTLLETLVALALIAVLLAVAVPALITPTGVQLRSAAHTVASGLRQARLEAIRQQRPIALQVDVEARTLQLEGKGRTRELPRELELELFTAQREMIEPQRGGIRFYPDGSSTGGQVTLTLDGLSTRVVVEWLTGRVRVEETPS
jgi:general secretion pathway protein H